MTTDGSTDDTVTVSRAALAACLDVATSNPYLGDHGADLAWLVEIQDALGDSGGPR